MTRQWSTHPTTHEALFSRHLLPLKDAIPGKLFAEAALPPMDNLSKASVVTASRAFYLACQSVHVIALRGPAITATLADRRRLSLIYVESGELELLHPEHACSCSAGSWILIPGCSLVWKSSSFSVICLLMSPEEIALILLILYPDARHKRPPTLPVLPHAFQANRQELGGVLLEMLTTLLQAVSRLYSFDPALLERLEIGNQISRLMALLIHPSIDIPAVAGTNQQVASHGREGFDALILYIKANLDQPLNLTVLATQSHYSRRTLQYAFRNWLGCTATQWIRRERLDLAWRLLQNAGPADNVTSIAKSCGYRSLSLFSIEFQHRFHIKPSVLLRRTRYSQADQGLMQDVDGTPD